MAKITSSDLLDTLAPYQQALPPGTRFYGRVIAPSFPAPGCGFSCTGDTASPMLDTRELEDPVLFNIGSTTKTFTALMLAQLNESRPENWGTITDYLSFLGLPSNIPDVPLADLAYYASGFDRDNDGPSWLAPDMLEIRTLHDFINALNAYIRNNTATLPQNTCGDTYTYSNLGFGLLGMCLAKLSNWDDHVEVKWNEQLQAMLTRNNLQMPNTCAFQCLTLEQMQGMAGLEGKKNTWKSGRQLTPNTVMYVGSGAITSTLPDMSNWLLFNMGYLPGSVTAGPALDLMQKKWFKGTYPNGNNAYTGLGWFMDSPEIDRGHLSKDGGVAGYSSFMEFDKRVATQGGPPKSSTGLVLLANFRDLPFEGKTISASDIGGKLMTFLSGGQ